MSDGASPSKLRQRVLLVVGEGRVERIPLTGRAQFSVGRDPSCDVHLAHPKISRQHITLHAGATLELEELGSTNGTRLAGALVPSRARLALAIGAPIQLGPFIAVVLEAPPERSELELGLDLDLVVDDPTVTGVTELVRRIARGPISVVIHGETGTGKEVLARSVHALSGRAGQLVAINCAALTEALLESELFGHERGAFTGATAAKPGLFEVAGGGTVFLDELCELPLALQAKLLRVLETREAYRLGATAPIRLDVRFIAASRRDLAAEVAAGRFRHDLWFRINGITLALPPLRERRARIPGLAASLLADAARAAGRPAPRLGPAALAALDRHAWPGNVRELRTVMERAVMLAAGDELTASDILLDRAPAPAEPAEPPDGKARFVAAAAAQHGNVSKLARALGTSRSQVRRLAARHGVDLARFR
ncbi:MAG TPA: sigma 54-interacting transcriptional regulator [Kofleriaceae bacterium]